ncbi:twitching motility protein PilT [Planktothricoides sp. SR001]|uniref:type II toxin-antitoxin system VapC family toxin n=1 Tax=Planktothricoides sp. SR001 TaxID=1705388 RepID=UPI0006C37988|nr:PIN domain-containing protein [Planktothricoides sp. SR001]KOR38577.1 twitching motility protein PilT [Planktothricoides sp. SR001]
MSKLCVDTSGWGNLVDRSQPFHSLAATLYRLARQQNHKIITTNYIMAELVALLTSPLRLTRPQIITFVESLRQSPYIEILHIDAETYTKAWQLLSSREDKNWSLVDCSSFVVMQQRNITEALTNDYHFEQAGFVRLLK